MTALQAVDVERPVLDLSGEALRAGLQIMVAGSEEHGGIERYVDAVKLKSTMFRQALVEALPGQEQGATRAFTEPGAEKTRLLQARPQQGAEAQLEAEREEQERDAHLREVVDHLAGVDVDGVEHEARDQVADQGRQSDLPGGQSR